MRGFERSGSIRDRFTVVVPTLDSAGWIESLHAYYRSIDVDPLYCVDTRSQDETATILAEIGARTAAVSSEAPRVEALVVHFKDLVETPWILRVDDDECPSAELVAWIRQTRCRFLRNAVAIPRRWLRFMPNEALEYAGSTRWDWARSQNGEDRQFRLYRKNAVRYVSDIHTPGFRVRCARQAPVEAVLYHFDWILRSREERMAKMARYESQQAKAGESKAGYYLPEDVDHWNRTGAIADPRVVGLAKALRTAREKRLVPFPTIEPEAEGGVLGITPQGS